MGNTIVPHTTFRATPARHPNITIFSERRTRLITTNTVPSMNTFTFDPGLQTPVLVIATRAVRLVGGLLFTSLRRRHPRTQRTFVHRSPLIFLALGCLAATLGCSRKPAAETPKGWIRELRSQASNDRGALAIINNSDDFKELVTAMVEFRHGRVWIQRSDAPASAAGFQRYLIVVGTEQTFPGHVRWPVELESNPATGAILVQDKTGAWVPEKSYSTWASEFIYNGWLETALAKHEHTQTDSVAAAPSAAPQKTQGGRPQPPFGPNSEDDVIRLIAQLPVIANSSQGLGFSAFYIATPSALTSSDGVMSTPWPVPCWHVRLNTISGGLSAPTGYGYVVRTDGEIQLVDYGEADRGWGHVFHKVDADGRRIDGAMAGAPSSAGPGAGASPSVGQVQCPTCKGAGDRSYLSAYKNWYNMTDTERAAAQLELRLPCITCGGKGYVLR